MLNNYSNLLYSEYQCIQYFIAVLWKSDLKKVENLDKPSPSLTFPYCHWRKQVFCLVQTFPNHSPKKGYVLTWIFVFCMFVCYFRLFFSHSVHFSLLSACNGIIVSYVFCKWSFVLVWDIGFCCQLHDVNHFHLYHL